MSTLHPNIACIIASQSINSNWMPWKDVDRPTSLKYALDSIHDNPHKSFS